MVGMCARRTETQRRLNCAQKYHQGCGVLYKTHLVRKCAAECVCVPALCPPPLRQFQRLGEGDSALKPFLELSGERSSFQGRMKAASPLLLHASVPFHGTVFVICAPSSIDPLKHLRCAGVGPLRCHAHTLNLRQKHDTCVICYTAKPSAHPRCTAKELQLHAESE